MKIEIAKNIGFCFGVKKAVQIVEDNLAQMTEPIQMYGNLVHNEEVTEKLTQKGIEVVNNLDEVKKGTLIITAHGVSSGTKNELQRRKDLEVLDTTCPIVKQVQNLAKKLFHQGKQVLILGDKDHSEVKGINGYTNKTAIVFYSEQEFDSIKIEKKKYALIVQTTQDSEKFAKIAKKARQKIESIEIFNTICQVVNQRQKEARKIAERNDIVLVVGSQTSANTTRLFKISSASCKNTYFVATKNELKKEWFDSKDKIGLISGTSTPNWVIREIKTYLKNLY